MPSSTRCAAASDPGRPRPQCHRVGGDRPRRRVASGPGHPLVARGSDRGGGLAHLLNELSTVLARPKLRRYVTPVEAQRIVASLEAEALFVPDPTPEPGLTADPRDDYLVALARAAGVTAMVSGDRHLTELDDPRPPVWTPRMLIERLAGG